MLYPVTVTMLADSGALTRFATPRELIKFLGLIPSASATGEQRRQGSMTKAGIGVLWPQVPGPPPSPALTGEQRHSTRLLHGTV
jgi:hypothetical protein